MAQPDRPAGGGGLSLGAQLGRVHQARGDAPGVQHCQGPGARGQTSTGLSLEDTRAQAAGSVSSVQLAGRATQGDEGPPSSEAEWHQHLAAVAGALVRGIARPCPITALTDLCGHAGTLAVRQTTPP